MSNYEDRWSDMASFSNFSEARHYATTHSTYSGYNVNCRYDNLSDKAKEAVPFEDFCAMILRVMTVIDNYDGDECGYDRMSTDAIAHNVALWAINKADKILAMKKCPLYNENEPYKIVMQANFERVKDEDTIYRYANNFDGILYEAISKLRSPKISEDDVQTYKGILENNKNSYFSDEDRRAFILKQVELASKTTPHVGQKTSRFIRNLITTVNGNLKGEEKRLSVQLSFETEIAGNGDVVHIAKGNVVKDGWDSIMEVSTSRHNEAYTGDEEPGLKEKLMNTFWEKSFANYADAINPVVFTRPTVLSLDYVDYILMSHGNGWESCHWINKEDATAGGCNSGGTWSYANDAVSYILYTTREDVETDYELADKVTREVVIFDEYKHELICDRVYPQSNDYGCSSVYTEHRNAAQKIISSIYGYSNLWNVFNFCGSNGSYADEELKEFPREPLINTPSDACQYWDYHYFKSSLNVPKEILTAYHHDYVPELDPGTNSRRLLIKYMNRNGEISVGESAYCPICGDNIRYNGDTHFICSDCASEDDGREYCASCGYAYDEEELHYCNDGEYRCDDCCFWDEYLQEYVANSDGQNEVYYADGYGSETLCDDSIDNAIKNGDVFKCADCGNYYFTKSFNIRYGVDYYEHTDGKKYCNECYEKNFHTCEMCGCIEHQRNMTEVEGNWYCDNGCLEEFITEQERITGETWYSCSCCDEWHRASKTHIAYRHRYNYTFIGEPDEEEWYPVRVCNDCYPNKVSKCPVCGREFMKDDNVGYIRDADGFGHYLDTSECLKIFVLDTLTKRIKRWHMDHITVDGSVCDDFDEFIGNLFYVQNYDARQTLMKEFDVEADGLRHAFAEFCKSVEA